MLRYEIDFINELGDTVLDERVTVVKLNFKLGAGSLTVKPELDRTRAHQRS